MPKKKTASKSSSKADNLVSALNSRIGENGAVTIDTLPKKYSYEDSFPTGSLALDLTMGTGGIPKRSFIHLHGPYTSGKSTLALEICRAYLMQDKTVLYIDVEQTMALTGQSYFEKIGITEDKHKANFVLTQRANIKDIVAAIETAMIQNIDLVVVDTVAMIVAKDPSIDMEKMDASKAPQMGVQAKILSDELKRLNALKEKGSQTSVLFLNQEKMELNAYASKNFRVPGGKAMEHVAEITIRLVSRKKTSYTEKMAGAGFESVATILKNKYFGNTKDKQCSVYIVQESKDKLGLDEMYDLIDTATNIGVIKLAGPWYAWESPDSTVVRETGIMNFIGKLLETPEKVAELYQETRETLIDRLKDVNNDKE